MLTWLKGVNGFLVMEHSVPFKEVLYIGPLEGLVKLMLM